VHILIRDRGRGKELPIFIAFLRYTENGKAPEEKPVRNPGGNYGFHLFSLTTQTFRFGGCPWPIHRKSQPEPYRVSAWDKSGVFPCKKQSLRAAFFVLEKRFFYFFL
jgi:hypothetical protein